MDSLDGTTVHAGPTWSFTTGAEPAAPYDALAELAAHNVAWTTPSTDSAGSMPLGNGDLGANVWVEANGDLLLLLSKTYAWSGNGRSLKLGRIRVALTPNPFAAGQPLLQTLNLPSGEILITAGPPGDSVNLRLWADAHHPALQIEATSETPRHWRADLEHWRTAPRNSVDSGQLHSAYGVINAPTPPVIRPDTAVTSLTNRVTWYHRNTHSIWRDTLVVQDLSHLIGSLTDPLLDRTFGAALFAEGPFTNSSPTRLECDAPRTHAQFTLVARTAITPTADAWLDSLDAAVAAVAATPRSQRYAAHADWWRALWQRHWLVVTAPGAGIVPGSDPFAVTQGYLLQRFMQAASGRGGAPIKFNGSIFTVDATSAYDADYRRWGPPYWWQNTRLPYWSMPLAGDLDLMEPLFSMYREALPLARERVQTWYGHAGGLLPGDHVFLGHVEQRQLRLKPRRKNSRPRRQRLHPLGVAGRHRTHPDDARTLPRGPGPRLHGRNAAPVGRSPPGPLRPALPARPRWPDPLHPRPGARDLLGRHRKPDTRACRTAARACRIAGPPGVAHPPGPPRPVDPSPG